MKIPDPDKPRVWATNASSEAIGLALVRKYSANDPSHLYSMGDPKGTEACSVEQMKSWKMVGVYKTPVNDS